MSLRETALNLGVKRKDTCKLFYGIYPYSLTGSIPQKLIDEKLTRNDAYWLELRRRKSAPKTKGWEQAMVSIHTIRQDFNAKVRKYIEKLIDKNAALFDGTDFFYTYSPTTFSIYTMNAKVTEALLLANKKSFIRFSDPYNEKCAEYLAKADPKVLVRQNLFEGEHEFRIQFKRAAEYTHLDDRVSSLHFGQKSYSYGFNTRTLYLSGDDDLFLARMGLEDQIERITKCVLVEQVA